MSDDGNGSEIGNAYIELAKAEKNLDCLEKRFSDFVEGMKNLVGRAEPRMEVTRSQDRIVQIGDMATDIRFMNAIEFESLVVTMRDTREKIQFLNDKLISLTGRSAL